jgi:predicted transporter
MELKSLILGLAFTLGIFAVKSGAGLAHATCGQRGWPRRALSTLVFALVYAPLFALSWWLAAEGGVVARLELAMSLARQGMTVHFLLALLLLLWGVALLRRPGQGQGSSRGWLLLALPCPVCFTVILGSTALLHASFADLPLLPLWLFFGFILTALLSAFFLSRFRALEDRTLGMAMVLAALYFLVTVAVVPQVKDLARIYRLAAAMPLAAADSLPVLAGLTLGCLAAFVATARKPYGKDPWT